MALSKTSLQQANQVLREILASDVNVIVTRATLDKKIELVKFPYLKTRHDNYRQNRTLYVSNQYDPIRYWLINNKFLTSSRDVSGRYQYRVNKDVILAFFANNSIEQSNNTKNESKKVMTKREKIFRHIEDNGNAMRYTDIIKFAYEITHGIGSFDKKKNRGYYACAFTYHSLYSWQSGDHSKNPNQPKGHFVMPTKSGYLKKLSNGLWSVVRPQGWTRSEANCETYEARIEKFLSSGDIVVERDIVTYLKPYVVQHRGKIGYDWGNTNTLLRKMIKDKKVYRVWCLNEKTGKFAYHYGLLDTAIECATSKEIDNASKKTSIFDNNNSEVPQEEYDSMCDFLKRYNITADQLDDTATKYWEKGDGDVQSCYAWAYYDLLEKAGALSDTTKSLQKEIDEMIDRIDAEEKLPIKEQKYVVISISDNYHKGIFTASELEEFFTEKDPEDYMIIEAGNMITLEKKVTTTFTIK